VSTVITSVAGSCGLGDAPETWLDGLRAGEPAPLLGAPERPDAVSPGAWRRMSRLSRLATRCAAAALAGRPGLDRGDLGLVWATGLGELVATERVLIRLTEEGRERVSPMDFQTSVHSTAAGHLGVALGISGPSETVCAGGATGLSGALHALLMLERVPAVLLVGGDVISPWLRRALPRGSEPGEGAAALLLERQGAGRSLTVMSGLGPAALARALPFPGETLRPVPGAVCSARTLGLSPTLGLLGLAALAAAGGAVVDQAPGLVLRAVVE